MADSPMPDASDDGRKRDVQVSAGGVLYRRRGDAVQVCLIAKRGGRVWALPKGRVDNGETPSQTAQREVLEETGHLSEARDHLDDIKYYFYWKDNNTLYHKVVSFYLMPLVRENERERDQEADAVAWFNIGDAFRRITYLNEKDILRKAHRIIRDGPPGDVPPP